MKRAAWVDVLRGIAIIAVVVDHIMYVFPTLRSESLWHHTYFSVPWFIFLSGVANVHSAKRQHQQRFFLFYVQFLWRRSGILIAYLLASLVSYTVIHKGQIDTSDLLNQLRLFSAQPTYYFINLLVQLYLLFPVLFWLMQRLRPWMIIGMTMGIAGVSWWLQEIIGYPPWPFSPAGRLFGSMYLLVFWMGMLMGQFGVPAHWFFWFTALEIFVFTEWALTATQGYFLGLTPTAPFILWAISLLMVVYLVVRVLPFPRALQSALAILGRYSVWIYLYHYLILLLILPFLPQLPWFVAVLLALVAGLVIPLIFGIVWRLLLIRKHAILGANAKARS